MQVFVPSSSDFAYCVSLLDKKRVWKQTLEATQIIDTIEGKTIGKGWKHHPACKAWQYNVEALKQYCYAAYLESVRQGIKPVILKTKIEAYELAPTYSLPVWWGDEEIHSSHRSRLLQKNYDFYSGYNWEEMNDNMYVGKDYVWPVMISSTEYTKRVIERKT